MKWIFILQKNLDGLVVKSYDYHITKVFARLIEGFNYRYTLLTTYYVYIFGMYVYKNIVLFILNIQKRLCLYDTDAVFVHEMETDPASPYQGMMLGTN